MTVNCRTKEELIAYLAEGGLVKYIFFWGHTPAHQGAVDKSCFSQWYNAGFDIDGVRYPTAEHYMMAEKARLFGDESIREKILSCTYPHEAKQLGRMVKHYDETVWRSHRVDIVTTGNIAKFSQNDPLKHFLCETGERVLVEASPRDTIWGIGLAKSDPVVENPAKWRGFNLLGFALMAVRERLLRSAE
jgi:ribA/ribD-fused uncharacterized protein